jgi:hypothetical protein
MFPTDIVSISNGRFRVEAYDATMRVPDIVLKCVGFVGEVTHQDSAGISGDLYATGFFVSVPCQSPGLKGIQFAYFVTAKHVATALKGKDIYFLVNKIGGGVIPFTTVFGNHWYLHPTDKTADVAVIQVGLQRDADIKTVFMTNFATPEKIVEMNLGIGDEVFAVGLFHPATGTSRNEPVVRHGNIAMMPAEQIQTKLGYADVYLIEARSIGGLSGSPVFVRPTIHLPVRDATTGMEQHGFFVGHGATLLGLMQGHWDIEESEINSPRVVHNSKRGVNMGFAIVVPAIKIMETINRSELVTRRRELEQVELDKMIPAADSMQREFTQEDFEAALRKVSRKIGSKQ